MNVKFSRQNFEKYSNVKFHDNPPSETRGDPCGRADGRADWHDEADSRF